jgi:hypothetical protein
VTDSHSVGGCLGGIYLYDMGSQHGTFVNKKVVAPKNYAELRVGDIVCTIPIPTFMTVPPPPL